MMKTKTGNRTFRRLKLNVATVIVLAICLCITTYALISSIFVKENIFSTGIVDIELNGGEAIIGAMKNVSEDEKEFIGNDDGTTGGELIPTSYNPLRVEPGMTIVESFYLENKSTCDIWYKLYFTDGNGTSGSLGKLADVIEVTITKQGSDKNLYSGKASGLTKTNSNAKEELTMPTSKDGEKIYYNIKFYFPKDEGNKWQNESMSFKLEAMAVQAKNNENAEF